MSCAFVLLVCVGGWLGCAGGSTTTAAAPQRFGKQAFGKHAEWESAFSTAQKEIGKGEFRAASDPLVDAIGEALLFAPNDPRTERTLKLTGEYMLRLRQGWMYDAAESFLKRLRVVCLANSGPVNEFYSAATIELANLYGMQQKWRDSRSLLEEYLAELQQNVRGEHPHIAAARSALVGPLLESGELDEAQRQAESAVASAESLMGPESQAVAGGLSALGKVFRYRGELRESRRFFERSAEVHKKAAGPFHPFTAVARLEVAATDVWLDDLEAAERSIPELVNVFVAGGVPTREHLVWAITLQASIAFSRGDLARAEALANDALVRALRAKRSLAPIAPLSALVEIAWMRGDTRKAKGYAKHASVVVDANGGADARSIDPYRSSLSHSAYRAGDIESALEWVRPLRTEIEDARIRNIKDTELFAVLSVLLAEKREYASALSYARALLDWERDHRGEASVAYQGALANMAPILAGTGQPAAAQDAFETSIASIRTLRGERSPLLYETVAKYADFLSESGKSAAAAEQRQRLAQMDGAYAHQQATPAAPAAMEYEDLNFRFESPGGVWSPFQIPTRPDLISAFINPAEQTVLMVDAIALGADSAPDLKQLARLVVMNSGADGNVVDVVSETPLSRDGVGGVRIVYTGDVQALEYRWVTWIASHNGYVYQLTVGGRSHEMPEANLIELHERVAIDGFSLLDRTAVAVSTANESLEFRSERYGYAVNLEGDWAPWPQVAAQLDGTEFGVLGAGGQGGAVWIPISHSGKRMEVRQLEAALLSRVAATGQMVKERKAVGELNTVDFRYRVPAEGIMMEYRGRLYLGDQSSLIVLSWLRADLVQTRADFWSLFDFVVPGPLSNAPAIETLTGHELRAHALFFNDLGLAYQQDGRTTHSIEMLKVAFAAEPEDAAIVENLASQYIAASRPSEAVETLNAGLERMPEAARLHSWRGIALAQLRRLDEAAEAYARAIELGIRDETVIEQYAYALQELDRDEEALVLVDRLAGELQSNYLRRVHAALLNAQGRQAEAADALKALVEQNPDDFELRSQWIGLQLELGSYHEALEASDALLVEDPRSLSALLLKAQAEYWLGWYRKSQQTLRAALKIEPTHEAARQMLDQVSTFSGEGDTEGLRQAIEPVPLPRAVERLLADVDSHAPETDLGAYHLYRVDSYHYEPGQARRRTSRFRARIVAKKGIEPLATLRYEFYPLAERIFVNRVEVFDAAGELLHRGKVEDYYVLDAPHENMATSRRALHIPVQGLEVGSDIVVEVSREDRGDSEGFEFVRHDYSTPLPTNLALLVVTGETGDLKHDSSLSVKQRREDAAMIWEAREPEVQRWEPSQSRWRTDLPQTRIGQAHQEWTALARTYLEELEERLAPDARAREVATSFSEADVAQRAARYVQDTLTYNAIEFGRRARIPLPVSSTLDNRYGDCKDHALLLQQLLRARGFSAHLALVNLSGPIATDLPSLDQFDHMVVYCADCGGGSPFLDATDKDVALGSDAPRYLGGSSTLLLDPEDPRLVEIGGYDSAQHRVSIDRDVVVAASGATTIAEEVSFAGSAGAPWRRYLRSVDQSTLKTVLQQELFKGVPGALIKEVDVKHLSDVSQPLTLTLDYELAQSFLQSRGSLVGKLPAIWERKLLSVVPVEDRTSPFELVFPFQLSTAARIEVPEGFAALNADPGNFSGKGDFLEWRGSIQTRERRIDLDYHFEQKPGVFDGSVYADYYRESDDAIRIFTRTTEFSRRGR
jgi:tetratricopeptide (TPR) repeat protein